MKKRKTRALRSESETGSIATPSPKSKRKRIEQDEAVGLCSVGGELIQLMNQVQVVM